MNKQTGLFFLVIVVLICLFYYAGKDIPINIWDEAIYANNAVEMHQSGNYLVLQNNGKPSLYNSKPPMTIWLQSLAMKVFGINEFSVRLPSLIAVFIISASLVLFLKRYRLGLVSSGFCILALFTSRGFMGQHIAGTGDLDAVLCMWTTLLGLTVLHLLLTEDHKISKTIWLAGLFFVGGYLTKSTAILLVLPGLALAVLLSNQRRKVLLNKHLYLAALSSLGVIAGYYLLLHALFPGYIDKVWQSEFQRFYKNIMPWHEQPWHFYLTNLPVRYSPWYLVILPCAALGLLSKSPIVRKLVRATASFCISYLILISIPAVKLAWYDAPLYPFFALIIGLGIRECSIMLTRLSERLSVGVLLLFALYCAYSYYLLLNERSNHMREPQEMEGSFIREAFKHVRPKQSTVVMEVEHHEHYDQLNFYRKKYKIENDLEIAVKAKAGQFKENDTVFVCQVQQIEAILAAHSADTIFKENQCLMLRISGPRNGGVSN